MPYTAHIEGCGIEAGVIVKTGCDKIGTEVTLGVLLVGGPDLLL